MKVRRLLRIDLTVADLARAERFYTAALGFTAAGSEPVDPALASLLGAEQIRQIVLRRGEQSVALQAFHPAGAPYPANASACDQSFQHFAMPVPDMAAAMTRLLASGPAPISIGGPQRLPQRSGGATAFKFRDPDGHPLELIEFPDNRSGGIDHSAIVVADAERSIAFYRETLGMRLGARQLNTGPEQDRLDGLDGDIVEVVALVPDMPEPHVELLAYRSPPVRPAAPPRPNDIVATRLVFEVDSLPHGSPALIADPDGHQLLLTAGAAGAAARLSAVPAPVRAHLLAVGPRVCPENRCLPLCRTEAWMARTSQDEPCHDELWMTLPEQGDQRALVDRLFAVRAVAVARFERLLAVAGEKDEADPAPDQHVGDRVRPLAVQVDVEDDAIWRMLLALDEGERLDNRAERTEHARAQLFEALVERLRQDVLVLDNEDGKPEERNEGSVSRISQSGPPPISVGRASGISMR